MPTTTQPSASRQARDHGTSGGGHCGDCRGSMLMPSKQSLRFGGLIAFVAGCYELSPNIPRQIRMADPVVKSLHSPLVLSPVQEDAALIILDQNGIGERVVVDPAIDSGAG